MIGLLDSGVAAHQQPYVVQARDFSTAQHADFADASSAGASLEDRLGHGTTLAQILIDALPDTKLCIARIFDRQLTTSAEQAAAGLDWLTDQGVRIINLSFGLRQDRAPLARACQRALDAGVILVASAPAFGAPVYPARYPGVIRVTGDARCQPGEHSWHPSNQADFGACVRAGHPRVVGASVACAYISARIGQFLTAYPAASQQPPNRVHLLHWLRREAHYQGPQRPFSLVPWKRRLTWDGAIS